MHEPGQAPGTAGRRGIPLPQRAQVHDLPLRVHISARSLKHRREGRSASSGGKRATHPLHRRRERAAVKQLPARRSGKSGECRSGMEWRSRIPNSGQVTGRWRKREPGAKSVPPSAIGKPRGHVFRPSMAMGFGVLHGMGPGVVPGRANRRSRQSLEQRSKADECLEGQ